MKKKFILSLTLLLTACGGARTDMAGLPLAIDAYETSSGCSQKAAFHGLC